MTQQRRIEERIALVDTKVSLNTVHERIHNCELVDVSPGGARLRLPEGTKRRRGGETVTLQTASAPLGNMFNNKQALIIWTDGDQLGMRLMNPLALPSEDLRKLLTVHLPDRQAG